MKFFSPSDLEQLEKTRHREDSEERRKRREDKEADEFEFFKQVADLTYDIEEIEERFAIQRFLEDGADEVSIDST